MWDDSLNFNEFHPELDPITLRDKSFHLQHSYDFIEINFHVIQVAFIFVTRALLFNKYTCIYAKNSGDFRIDVQQQHWIIGLSFLGKQHLFQARVIVLANWCRVDEEMKREMAKTKVNEKWTKVSLSMEQYNNLWHLKHSIWFKCKANETTICISRTQYTVGYTVAW